jgi:hypothetical protein
VTAALQGVRILEVAESDIGGDDARGAVAALGFILAGRSNSKVSSIPPRSSPALAHPAGSLPRTPGS